MGLGDIGDLGDMVDKAKEMAGGDAKVDEMIDKAADVVEEKTPDNVDGMVETAADKAKHMI